MLISKSDQQLIQELHEEVKALRAENGALQKLVKDGIKRFIWTNHN